MQVRFTMNQRLASLTGRPMIAQPLMGAARSSRAQLPEGVPADAVRFTRRPDVILILIESTRADFLDAETMPRLLARAQRGSQFLRHYSAATSTDYSVFSLFYALQSQKREAATRHGRPPLLFGALRDNGYAMRFFAASSIDWMDIRRRVFGSVAGNLVTDLPGRDGAARDAAMMGMARRAVAAVDSAQPLFLFLFFDGTHYTYSYSPGTARFQPEWDGRGTGSASRVSAEKLRNRARNAAYEVDRRIDAFLSWYTRERGQQPLVFVTGDHGEEYREHGRVGHGTAVTVEQAQVPLVVTGPGVPVGPVSAITSSVDIVPTMFALLGDTLTSSRYSDGMSLYAATTDRFVLTSVGWTPKFAVIGSRLKATFATSRDGLNSLRITDPWDRPLPDGNARFAVDAPRIVRAIATR
jgi:membrane-anchored protein YejM (alkaline phosphatase superfamily)